MKVVVSHSYYYRFDAKQWKQGMPYPPLMTLQAAACLRNEDAEITFWDANLRRSPDEIIPVLNEVDAQVLVLFDDGFNYLSKMCLSRMRDAAFQMIRHARERKMQVWVCSSDSTDSWKEYLQAGADVVIPGEGEASLVELYRARKQGTDYSQVTGIIYQQGNNFIQTGKRPVMRHLDDLPEIAWDLADMESYRSIWMEKQGYFSLNISTTRGCPYKCNWCAKPIYGNRYNARSPARVADEMLKLVNTTGVSHFWMSDDIFGLKPGWVEEFGTELKKRNLRIPFKIQSRADLLQDEATVKSLAEAGLQEVWMGAESGSQKILNAMEKGITVEQVYHATRLCRKHGIRVAFFLQFGYLNEKEEDIKLTLKMLWELMPEDIGISVSYPLPGTAFFDAVKSKLGTKTHWEHSDDLDRMYPSEYSPGYYRILHRFVHHRYRSKQNRTRWMHQPFQIKALAKSIYFQAGSLWFQRKLVRKV